MARKSAAKASAPALQDGERDWVSKVVADLADDDLKLVYADWLEERGDERSQFLRQYVAASRSMSSDDFPATEGLSEEWLELIGFRLVDWAATVGSPDLKDRLLRFARPALRMNSSATKDKTIPVGASKVGGLPDLPEGFRWPAGDDCRAIYNDSPKGEERLAGFLAQINLAEVAHSQATRELPKAGVLSFFCFQDIENDNPDVIGVRALFFPDPAELVRTEPPEELTEGNTVINPMRLSLTETLDIPEYNSGPWWEELNPNPDSEEDEIFEHFRSLNFYNFLGYTRSTTGGDPTASRDIRHLILLKNAVECRLHIQLSQKNLTAMNFDEIILAWVDFG